MEKMDTCPWCGGALRKGWLHTNAISLNFAPEDVDVVPLTKKAREQAGVVSLPPGPWLSKGVDPVAYHCSTCRKVIIPY